MSATQTKFDILWSNRSCLVNLLNRHVAWNVVIAQRRSTQCCCGRLLSNTHDSNPGRHCDVTSVVRLSCGGDGDASLSSYRSVSKAAWMYVQNIRGSAACHHVDLLTGRWCRGCASNLFMNLWHVHVDLFIRLNDPLAMPACGRLESGFTPPVSLQTIVAHCSRCQHVHL